MQFIAQVLATLACVLPVDGPRETFQGRVVAVADGDTLTVLRDREQVKIRLHGIDSPERGQPFGTVARSALGDLCAGQLVTVEVRSRDRYGRSVASVILPDGRDASHEMVRAGLAWWFQKYALHDTELERLEQAARDDKRGLWADKDPVPPWEWRNQKKIRSGL